MSINGLQLGDLVSLKGLEKPQGILQLELEGKAEKGRLLGVAMNYLADKVEDSFSLQLGDVTALVDSFKNALKRELSPEQSVVTLAILEKRFISSRSAVGRRGLATWELIKDRLEKAPEKLWSLSRMEFTGGEPNVMDLDRATGEYIFMDTSEQTPEGRRNCVYDRVAELHLMKEYPDEKCAGNAVTMAKLMGVDLLTEQQYRFLRTKGRFDDQSWTWLKSPDEMTKTKRALFGYNLVNAVVGVDQSQSFQHEDKLGFRALLRV